MNRSGRIMTVAGAALLTLSVLGNAGAQTGARVYAANCAGCHGAQGKGVPTAFPPLAGHVPNILRAMGGRSYAVKVVQNGLAGKLNVKGMSYAGSMPSFGKLSDVELAAVLNFVATSWGNKLPTGSKPFTATEVKKRRAGSLTAQQVRAQRPKTLK